MINYFSEKFKVLRKTKDLTQEQIADIFHISPQSVSRWETGANYPDIEILPHIAGFFNVTVDELLGTEKILDESKVAEFIKKIREFLSLGKVSESVMAARKATKAYPVNYNLQVELMNALDAERKAENKNEIIEIGERVINHCTNSYLTMQVKQMLLMNYLDWDMKDKAIETLQTLPPLNDWCSREENATFVASGDEWAQNQQTLILRYTQLLCKAINNYAYRYEIAFSQKSDPLKIIECEKTCIRILREIYEDEGDFIFNASACIAYANIASLYCEVGDAENALNYSEKATNAAVYRCTNKWEGYKSTLLVGRRFEHEYQKNETSRNECWVVWEDIFSRPQFDIIRNNERFVNCLELLKSNSNELNEKIPRLS